MKKLLAILIILLGSFFIYNQFFHFRSLPQGCKIDKIVVYKSQRKMIVFQHDTQLKTYTIALGRQPKGAKQVEGDGKTPEGTYIINDRNQYSKYHKNLGISYPALKDKELARQLGKPTGGNIKIHGLPNGQGYWNGVHKIRDWTNGCIAVNDSEIDELYQHVMIGATIIIYP